MAAARKQRKAKFAKGQVVRYQPGPGVSALVRIRSMFDSLGNCYIDGHQDGWAHFSELRPLTRREAENVFQLGYAAGVKATRRERGERNGK